MQKWYIIYNGQQVGPMTEDELLAYNLTPQSEVWCEGMKEWQPLYTLPELMKKVSQTVNIPPLPGVPPVYCPRTNKNNIVAGILALILGGWGIHYFYCGKTTAGLLTILLEFCTCGLWSIIILIQAITILIMGQEEFEQKYVLTDKSFPLF